jgi:hypothetical protein
MGMVQIQQFFPEGTVEERNSVVTHLFSPKKHKKLTATQKNCTPSHSIHHQQNKINFLKPI